MFVLPEENTEQAEENTEPALVLFFFLLSVSHLCEDVYCWFYASWLGEMSSPAKLYNHIFH